MSAQITTKVDHLVNEIINRRKEENDAEELRFQAAKAAKKAEIANFIETKLVDVLPILGLHPGLFYFEEHHNGLVARIDWRQSIRGEEYPLSISVANNIITIFSLDGFKTVSKKTLTPGVSDPVFALGEFLADLPQNRESLDSDKSAETFHRLRRRIDNAGDADALLAVAAAADADDALFSHHRSTLRKEVAWAIRNLRNQERTARKHRNADLIYANEIIDLAMAYLQECAEYDNACYDWATGWTSELWAPSELYRMRYVPVTADGNTEHCIQEITVMDHPSTLDVGGDGPQVVTEVTGYGNIHQLWIGAFLDARPVHWDEPFITARIMHHRSVRAGDYYVNVPADDLSPVDLDAVKAARPAPPAHWFDWLKEHYHGAHPLTLPKVSYNGMDVGALADEIVKMTPAEFIDRPQINL